MDQLDRHFFILTFQLHIDAASESDNALVLG